MSGAVLAITVGASRGFGGLPGHKEAASVPEPLALVRGDDAVASLDRTMATIASLSTSSPFVGVELGFHSGALHFDVSHCLRVDVSGFFGSDEAHVLRVGSLEKGT